MRYLLILSLLVVGGCTTPAALEDEDGRVLMAAKTQAGGVYRWLRGESGYCKAVDTEGAAGVEVTYHPDGGCTIKITTTEGK